VLDQITQTVPAGVPESSSGCWQCRLLHWQDRLL